MTPTQFAPTSLRRRVGVVGSAALIGALALFTQLRSSADAFISGGEARGAIVLGSGPTHAEQFAAEELQAYLRRMTGARVEIMTGDAPAGRPAVYIGGHPFCRDARSALRAYSRDREAFALVGDSQSLCLVGNGETATVYAAWEWLQRLGVRWLLPGPNGDFAPRLDRVLLGPMRVLQKPGMTLRGPNYAVSPEAGDAPEHGLSASRLFSYRMRMNAGISFDQADAWASIGAGHSYAQYLPASRYARAHPDWFALVNGRRQSGPDAQVNFTSAGAADQFATNMLAEIRRVVAAGASPDRLMCWVSPNDTPAWCEDAGCRALADGGHSASSMVVHFANEVALRVRREFPAARIFFYAYDNYAMPPEHEQPEPGVCPQITFWPAADSTAANHARPMFDAANARFQSIFRGWASKSDALSVYEYYGSYNWFTPWPKLTQIAVDVPALADEPKLLGMTSESHPNWGTQNPNFWVHARLEWNPGLDADRLLDDFCAAAYGPGGPGMADYYRALQRQMDSLPYASGAVTEIPSLLMPDVVSRCAGYIRRAGAKRDAMDAGQRWRMELAEQAWRASVRTAEALRLRASGAGSRQDRDTILADLDAARSFAASDLGRRAFDPGVALPRLDEIAGPLRIDLTALPPGVSTFEDQFAYGGAVRFSSTRSGFAAGMWGLSVLGGGEGTLTIPLRAAPGHTIRHVDVHVHWNNPGAGKVENSVGLAGRGGGSALADALGDAAQGISRTLDEGTAATSVTVRVRNLTGTEQIAVTGITIRVEVD